MPLSRSAIAWAVSGTLGVGTCTLGIIAMNSGIPANADPQPAIMIGATLPASPSASPAPTLTAKTTPTAATAKTAVSAKSPASPKPKPTKKVSPNSPKSTPSPVSPPSPKSANSGD